MHPLAAALRAAAEGRFPPADGAVELHPRAPGPASAVVAFTGHHVIAADVPERWLRERTSPGDLQAPMSPRFLDALSDRLGVACDGIDAVLAARPLEGRCTLRDIGDNPRPRRASAQRDGASDHPRARQALAHRDAVRVLHGDGVVLTLGRGLAGRLELSFEVAPDARGRGLARAALLDARRLADGEAVFAQVAPGNAASMRALLAAGFAPIGAEALYFDRATEPSAAVVITGGPGTGKSSVAQALTTLLDNAGVPHGAIETEQLAWGTPWLVDAQAHAQLERVLAHQRRFGRRLFVVVATTETQADLEGLLVATGAERTFVVSLRAPGEVSAARVLAREPERWAGREALAAHARELASAIPALPGVDLVLDTDGRDEESVAAELHAALQERGQTPFLHGGAGPSVKGGESA